jgi:DNA-directed RNA polymerase subunit RPC12/RpoP
MEAIEAIEVTVTYTCALCGRTLEDVDAKCSEDHVKHRHVRCAGCAPDLIVCAFAPVLISPGIDPILA